MVEVLDFLMGYESYLHIGLKQTLQTDRKTSSFVALVPSLSLVYLHLKYLVDFFSFHLPIFHWFIATPSRWYFQGHSP
jgi:hypothetical protein